MNKYKWLKTKIALLILDLIVGTGCYLFIYKTIGLQGFLIIFSLHFLRNAIQKIIKKLES